MLDQIRKRASINKRKKRGGITRNSPVCLPPQKKKTYIKTLGGETKFSEVAKKFIINSNLKKKIKCKK